MSREIRRVPIGWRHPVEHNPHWAFQQSVRVGGMRSPQSRLHAPTERFVSLSADYPDAVASWEQDVRDMEARTGFEWDFALRWHITGYDDCQCHPGQTGIAHPSGSRRRQFVMTRFAGDGNTRRLRTVAQRAGTVLQFEARRVRSQARARREQALAAWLRNQPAGLHELNLTDLVELLGYLSHLPEPKVKDFFYEAQGHLHHAAKCADGDPAQARNVELFHSCIADAVAADDAKAAGR